MNALNYLMELEDDCQFEEAFEIYNSLYSQNKDDYELWKHFYFFLWISIEDAPGFFKNKINLRRKLQEMLDDGISKFSDSAEFNFIAGYTISIFPYEFGEYENLKNEGQMMLQEATKLDSHNPIYKMVYLGSLDFDKQNYKQACVIAAPEVLKKYNGKGFLNKYFKEILYRVDKKY